MNIENPSGLSAFSASCRDSPQHVKPLAIEAMHPHSIKRRQQNAMTGGMSMQSQTVAPQGANQIPNPYFAYGAPFGFAPLTDDAGVYLITRRAPRSSSPRSGMSIRARCGSSSSASSSGFWSGRRRMPLVHDAAPLESLSNVSSISSMICISSEEAISGWNWMTPIMPFTMNVARTFKSSLLLGI